MTAVRRTLTVVLFRHSQKVGQCFRAKGLRHTTQVTADQATRRVAFIILAQDEIFAAVSTVVARGLSRRHRRQGLSIIGVRSGHGLKQLPWRPLLHHGTTVHHEDPVCVHHRV